MAEIAALMLLSPKMDTAQAQGGGDSSNKKNNYEALAQGGPVAAFAPAEEGDIDPLSDGSGVEVISNGAFRNDGNSVDGWFNLFSGGYIRNNSADFACFMAPTYPPDGAILTQFRISLLDQSTSDLIFVDLRRVSMATGAVDLVAGGTSVPLNSPTAVELSTGIVPGTQVVSSAYVYYVDLCFPPNSSIDILFYGARLFYTP
jgi:hypothetical protein